MEQSFACLLCTVDFGQFREVRAGRVKMPRINLDNRFTYKTFRDEWQDFEKKNDLNLSQCMKKIVFSPVVEIGNSNSNEIAALSSFWPLISLLLECAKYPPLGKRITILSSDFTLITSSHIIMAFHWFSPIKNMGLHWNLRRHTCTCTPLNFDSKLFYLGKFG